MADNRSTRLSRIRTLESTARLLEPTGDERNTWNNAACSFAVDSFHSEDYSDEGSDIEPLLEYLDLHLHHPGINAASGGHLGYVPGGGIYGASLGDYLAAVFNRYAGIYFASPGAVKMENSLIRWTGNLIGYTGNFAGNLTSGGSIANLIAIATARSAKQIRGMDYPRQAIYFSEHVHHCVTKDLRILGMDECVLREIPVDHNFHMDPAALERQVSSDIDQGLNPFLVIATAGTTDSGVVDPLEKIADISEKYDLWYHVDGAYGGYFILTQHGRTVLKGIERSDSFVVDPHKSLFLPFGSGMVVVRESRFLKNAHNATANYMQDAEAFDEELSPADASPELTKHFRGLRMWLPLRLHGIKPFRACLNEKLELARYFYDEVKSQGFHTGPEPELTIVLFRKGNDASSNDENRKIARELIRDGQIFISTTSINGIYWLRVAILSFRTHVHHIDIFL
ncbi:MAG: aminotransferase class I/II-fold pyridoxal phosphate-dependent enzyme, partial [Cyclobacteriaceae bacterium]